MKTVAEVQMNPNWVGDGSLSFGYWTTEGEPIWLPSFDQGIKLNRDQFTKIALKLYKDDKMQYKFYIKKDDGVLEDALEYPVPCIAEDVLAVDAMVLRMSDLVLLKNVKFTTDNCGFNKAWNAKSGKCEQTAGHGGQGER